MIDSLLSTYPPGSLWESAVSKPEADMVKWKQIIPHGIPQTPNRLRKISNNMTEENQQSSPGNSEAFGNATPLPFGNVPKAAEVFRTIPNASERKEQHTLTVRDVARMFETAGVARTERSIVNWCRRDPTGAARLDAYYDPNERRYYITPQSVDRAIAEEKAKMARHSETAEAFGKVPNTAESFRSIPNGSEQHGSIPKDAEGFGTGRNAKDMRQPVSEADGKRIREMEVEIMDLKITNRAKDMFIQQLQQDREHFVKEQDGFIAKLIKFTRKVGQLETQVLQLGGKPDVGSEESTSAEFEDVN